MTGHRARAEWHTELQVSVFVCGHAVIGRRPLFRVIAERARAAGLSGATAVHGLAGFGAAGVPARAGLFGPDGFEPVVIEITGQPDRVNAFLPDLAQLAGSALILVKTVRVAQRAAIPEAAAAAVP